MNGIIKEQVDSFYEILFEGVNYKHFNHDKIVYDKWARPFFVQGAKDLWVELSEVLFNEFSDKNSGRRSRPEVISAACLYLTNRMMNLGLKMNSMIILDINFKKPAKRIINECLSKQYHEFFDNYVMLTCGPERLQPDLEQKLIENKIPFTDQFLPSGVCLGYHYTVKHEDLNKELFNYLLYNGCRTYTKSGFPKLFKSEAYLILTLELIKNIPTATMRV